MTYNVFGGTLNLSQQLRPALAYRSTVVRRGWLVLGFYFGSICH